MTIKINNLAMELIPNLDDKAHIIIIGDDRCTGETTGYLLGLLSDVILNPSKKHFIRETLYGYRNRTHEFDALRHMIARLDLKCIKMQPCDFSIQFNLYSTYKDQCDLARSRG